VKRVKSSRSDRIGSDLREINIFVGLTLIIFFVAIGFPTLINTSPTLGYEGIDFTPVTTMYQEAYAEMELRETFFWYSYNPLLFDTYTYKWLVSIAPPQFPPDNPFTRYLETEIELGVGIVKQLLTEPMIPQLVPNIHTTVNRPLTSPLCQKFTDVKFDPKVTPSSLFSFRNAHCSSLVSVPNCTQRLSIAPFSVPFTITASPISPVEFNVPTDDEILHRWSINK